MNITKELVKYCYNLRYDDLPLEVVDRTKYLVLDFIGVAGRGSLEDSTKVLYRFIKDISFTTKGGVIIGTKGTAPYQYSALANGTSAHALELDDVNNEALLHPGCVIFSAAFAACEMVGADGTKFIEGVVVGYEVMVRLGIALGPSAHYAQGFHPTATCGAFGAAIAASKILGLDEGQMLNAMGITGSQAAGSLQFLHNGAWTKRMHPGWAAHSGLIAAILAKKGFKGPSAILEGKYGFLHAYSPSSNTGKILEGIGKNYKISRTSIKPHACCRFNQGPIDGILHVMRQDRLRADEVLKVTVGVLKAGFPIVVTPEELKYNPQSVVDAQFSMPFGAAIAILFGKASLEEYTQEKVNSLQVKEMMDRIICVENPELDKVYPKQWPASVQIETKDGKIFSTWIDYPKGEPENPLSWDELIEKFWGLARPIYTKARVKKLIEEIKEIERRKDLKQWALILLKDR